MRARTPVTQTPLTNVVAPMITEVPPPSLKDVRPQGNQEVVSGTATAHPNRGLHSTRASRAWVRIFPATVVLAVILIFAFQNMDRVKVSFATASGKLPLALALFVAAALGGLLVLALGSIRIAQLRKVIHHYRSTEAVHPSSDKK